MPDPVPIRDAAEWRAWLDEHHETASEVWVLYWKKSTGKPSIVWAEAVEVALSYGWIDGLIRGIDDECYMQRWTPRRAKSKWSNVNREIATRLIASGEMRPMGLAAVGYAGQRTQFGKPIAGHQLVQQLLAAIAVDTAAARLLVWQVADLIDRDQPFATEASMAKLFASEAAVRAANNAVQVFGGYGYIDEYPVGKYLRDARVATLYEGTSQIQQLLIGRALTGVNAF